MISEINNMEKNLPFIITLSMINIPLYVLFGKLFFDTWYEFWDCIKFWFKPDCWSWVDGEYWDDVRAEFKLGMFFVACGGLVYGEYCLILKSFPKLVYSINGMF